MTIRFSQHALQRLRERFQGGNAELFRVMGQLHQLPVMHEPDGRFSLEEFIRGQRVRIVFGQSQQPQGIEICIITIIKLN